MTVNTAKLGEGEEEPEHIAETQSGSHDSEGDRCPSPGNCSHSPHSVDRRKSHVGELELAGQFLLGRRQDVLGEK